MYLYSFGQRPISRVLWLGRHRVLGIGGRTPKSRQLRLLRPRYVFDPFVFPNLVPFIISVLSFQDGSI